MTEDNTVMPDNCTHNCNTCGESCNSGEATLMGQFEKTMDAFSKVETDDLLNALSEIANS